MKTVLKISSFFILALCLALPAHAIDLKGAKSAGFIGEQSDGYLGIVTANPSQEVRNLVNTTNQKRREKYKSIMDKNGQPLNIVEQLAGAKLIERTKPGNYYTAPNGKWVKK